MEALTLVTVACCVFSVSWAVGTALGRVLVRLWEK